MIDDDDLLDPMLPPGTPGALSTSTGASTYTPKNASVSKQLTGLLKADSPMLTQARTNAKKAANRRGLLNSSIAAGAGEAAAYDVALPIASQEAQQIHQTNLTGTDIASKEKVAFANISAHDREKATSAAVAMENIYGEAFRTIAHNQELPADARNAYLQHLGFIRDSNMNLIEQLYGIDLDWGTPSNPASPTAPA
jgi:hypothetical protein